MPARQPAAIQRREVIFEFFAVDQRSFWLPATAEIQDSDDTNQCNIGQQAVVRDAKVCQS